MLLTQFAIQKTEPRDTPYKLADGNGLFLLIKPNGKKQWRFRYFFAGKEYMLAFGTYPEITLASARRKREEARTLVAEGIDPSLKRRADKMAVVDAARNTFGVIAAEYLEHLKEDNRAQTTMEKNTWLLNDLAKPLHQCPIKEITAAEVLALLKKVEKTGRRETTRRLADPKPCAYATA
jgi:Arm DNA-binding domain